LIDVAPSCHRVSRRMSNTNGQTFFSTVAMDK
jgi:hypothetical protein